MADPTQIMTELTGPGGRFELVEEDVLGVRLPVFADRPRSLQQVLADSADLGDRPYLVTSGGRTLTYAEHAAMACSLGAALRDQHGVRPGDRVAILGANSPEWILAFWGAQWAGAIAMGFNAWWSADEVAYAVGHTEPGLVFTDERRAATLADVGVPVLSLERDVPALASADARVTPAAAEPEEDDRAVILFTSGTTGRPKGVVHTHRNVCAVTCYHRLNDELARQMGMPDDPPRRDLMMMPLFHIGSLHNLAVARMAAGTTIALYEGRFDVEKVLSFIERERITNWGAVPTMVHRIVEHPELERFDLSSLRQFALASAPSSPAFKDRVRETIPIAALVLADSYGLTETSTAITVASPMDLSDHPGTLGRPIVGVEVEIRDGEGQPVSEGTEGEIWARSQFNMLEYWRDPEATARTIDGERWLATGDLGHLEDGRLYLQTRRSDLIIRGGENVYPAEVENVLDEHEAVDEALVVGVDDEDLGQQVAAIVVLREPAAATAEELRAFLADRLAYYKVPAHWHLTDEPLPRNATGKVVRARAIEQAALERQPG